MILNPNHDSDDDRVRSRAEFHIPFVANLDRYCLNAMLSSVKDIPKELRTRRVDTVRDALREVIHGRRRRNLETELNSAWVYRHQSLDHGRTHVRHVSLLSHIDREHAFNVIRD